MKGAGNGGQRKGEGKWECKDWDKGRQSTSEKHGRRQGEGGLQVIMASGSILVRSHSDTGGLCSRMHKLRSSGQLMCVLHADLQMHPAWEGFDVQEMRDHLASLPNHNRARPDVKAEVTVSGKADGKSQ